MIGMRPKHYWKIRNAIKKEMPKLYEMYIKDIIGSTDLSDVTDILECCVVKYNEEKENK